MTDDLVDTLRHLDGTEYPGRGDRLDPALVVHAGRRRRRNLRIAGTSATCVVVLALGLAVPSALHLHRDRSPEPPVGVPTSTAPATGSPTPAASRPPVTVPSIPSPLPGNAMAPPGAILAPGILAATGVPATPFATTGVGEATADRWFHLGTTDGTSLVLHVATTDTGQTFAAYGLQGGAAGALVPGGTEARFDADPSSVPGASTVLPGHDGMFTAGLTPPGIAHAFYVSTGGFDTGDGTRRFALEVPLFDVPRVATVPDPGERMFALAFTQPATDRIYDMTNAMVFTTADGSIVDPSCDGGACPSASTSVPDAYAEIQAILDGTLRTPCAEFPATPSTPGDADGWWNASPADADANVLWDAGLWPSEPREHPRVALVDTDTGAVISTWDRIACGPDPTFVPTRKPDWPAHSVAVVDMDSGETIDY